MSDTNIIVQEVGAVTVLTTNFIPLVSTIGTGSSGGSGSNAWADITGKPSVFSSSAQVDYTSIQNKPSTIATASYVASVPFGNLTSVPALVSGAAQIDFNGLSNTPAGLVSSSTQIAYSGISGVSVGILSSSTQVNALSGVSASFAQTASLANGVQFAAILNKPVIFSSSAQLPANIVSSSTQATTWTVASASVATTASFVATPFTVNVSVTNPSASIQTGYVTSFDIPANCYLNKVRIRSVSSGSIAFDIRRATLAGWGSAITSGTSITGSTAVSMSANQKYEDSTLTGWTRNLQADDTVNVFVTSVSGSATFNNATLTLFLTRV